MVKRQFETTVKRFWTYNGGEYVNKELPKYWADEGIVYNPIVSYSQE
jgi:hypothetical protein